ncbi:hypothetical protein EYF80_019459 [Liparis tanakae]|uniref:Uncharacterized protein n=1 Tax=Liparis tanakae TaxID=230148 RepID=A0A4Z2HY46_9TELE|nr:hypothetical protein EYF80_019459 [Liparis tanakae]
MQTGREIKTFMDISMRACVTSVEAGGAVEEAQLAGWLWALHTSCRLLCRKSHQPAEPSPGWINTGCSSTAPATGRLHASAPLAARRPDWCCKFDIQSSTPKSRQATKTDAAACIAGAYTCHVMLCDQGGVAQHMSSVFLAGSSLSYAGTEASSADSEP